MMAKISDDMLEIYIISYRQRAQYKSTHFQWWAATKHALSCKEVRFLME